MTNEDMRNKMREMTAGMASDWEEGQILLCAEETECKTFKAASVGAIVMCTQRTRLQQASMLDARVLYVNDASPLDMNR
jgi:hypothetical protein